MPLSTLVPFALVALIGIVVLLCSVPSRGLTLLHPALLSEIGTVTVVAGGLLALQKSSDRTNNGWLFANRQALPALVQLCSWLESRFRGDKSASVMRKIARIVANIAKLPDLLRK